MIAEQKPKNETRHPLGKWAKMGELNRDDINNETSGIDFLLSCFKRESSNNGDLMQRHFLL
ncbi:MAG: hypothetical protein ACI89U_002180 [Gammaproteobacteria bacterium]